MQKCECCPELCITYFLSSPGQQGESSCNHVTEVQEGRALSQPEIVLRQNRRHRHHHHRVPALPEILDFLK